MKIYLLSAILLFNFSPVNAQDTSAVKVFGFMKGVWKGNGWTMDKKKKVHFNETETVSEKLNGTIMQLEAFGTAVEDSAEIINNALGLLLFNHKKRSFDLHVYQADGSLVVADVISTGPAEMEWRLDISPVLKIKYIIRVEGIHWYEAGYRCTDGINWDQHFEMRLLKVNG